MRINIVLISGRAIQTPVYTTEPRERVFFRLAVPRNGAENGEKSLFPVVAYNKLATRLAEAVKPGDELLVNGVLIENEGKIKILALNVKTTNRPVRNMSTERLNSLCEAVDKELESRENPNSGEKTTQA